MRPVAKRLATLLVVLSVGTQVAGFRTVRAAPRQTSLRSYHLARIEISGLHTLSAASVLAMSGLRVNTLVTQRDVEAASVAVKAGDLADVDRLNNSLELVKTRYRRSGYLAIQIVPDNLVSEAAHTVACRVTLVEGPRFHFRSITVTGLDAGLASRILARCTLSTGQFYDGTYLRQFVAAIRDAERDALAGRTVITIREKPDLATLTVDVVLEFARPGTPRNVPARWLAP